jgi:23S rRNA pseudouridine2605 synthase
MPEERLQKLLSHAGYASRRDCEDLIREGRVTVNGKKAILGTKADPQVDVIEVDHTKIDLREKFVYIALNKPRGVISTVDTPDTRKTVRDLIPIDGHIYPVGRLDFDSEGLILMTNDGELANKITHPRYGHEKEYRVLIAKKPDDDQLSTWRRGVVLDDNVKTQPARVYTESEAGKGMWLRIIMHEGRKRQIRETGMKLGLPVVRIIRVRIGPIMLGTLKPGEWRYLTESEIRELKK